MSYSFDISGVAPVWNFFRYQQQVEQSPERGCAYVGSYECTLDGFIEATTLVHQRPNWDWDRVASEIVAFWMQSTNNFSQWQQELRQAKETSLVVGRIANFNNLRTELEELLDQ